AFIGAHHGAEILVCLAPPWADLIAKAYPDVEDVQERLWAHAALPIDRWPAPHREKAAENGRVDEDGLVHLVASPEHMLVVVCGGWGPHSLEYAQHVDWVHLAGTGIDSYPREMFDGRIVTNARGASAIPIAEFVLAAMLAFEKRLPETWIHEPPEHWNFARLGWLNTRTLGLVGLGGIGLATAERALPFGMKVRAL